MLMVYPTIFKSRFNGKAMPSSIFFVFRMVIHHFGFIPLLKTFLILMKSKRRCNRMTYQIYNIEILVILVKILTYSSHLAWQSGSHDFLTSNKQFPNLFIQSSEVSLNIFRTTDFLKFLNIVCYV